MKYPFVSTRKSVVPEDWSSSTLTSPLTPRNANALFASVRRAAKLIAVARPGGMPAGLSLSVPSDEGTTTVMLTDTAIASDGIPHWPARTNVREEPADRLGPPYGPAAFLVSRIRQGVSV